MVELTPSAFAGSRIDGVFTDIDDTLTTQGSITSDALDALAQLRAAGVHVIPITGRPIGWSEPFARSWPNVLVGPWPHTNDTSSPSGSSLFLIEAIRVW